MEKWWPCEHIYYNSEFKKWVCHDRRTWESPTKCGWNLCPICGAKRPEEPKKLWEVLIEALGIGEIHYISQVVKDECKAEAKAAVEFFEKVIDSIDEHVCKEKGDYNLIDKNKLKQHLRSRAGI